MGDIPPQSTHFCFITTWLYEGSKARVVNGFNIWQHFSFNDSAKLTNYPTKLEQSWPNFSFIKGQQVRLGKALLIDWVSAKAIKLLDLSPNFYQTRARSLLITVDDEDRVANNLLQIGMVIKLNFLKLSLLFRLWVQGLVKILKLKFTRDFEAELWSVFCCWCLVEVTNLNLGQDFKFKFSRAADILLRFLS